MTIEDIIQGLKETNMICNSVFAYDRKKYIDGAIDRLRKYQLMQADYEARLRADMVAILEEIRIKADELQGHVHNSDFWDGVYTYDGIIEAKIKNLKGEEDGKHND